MTFVINKYVVRITVINDENHVAFLLMQGLVL